MEKDECFQVGLDSVTFTYGFMCFTIEATLGYINIKPKINE